MDVVISVAYKDCLIVKKTIRFIRRNIETETIYIMTDKKNFVFFRHSFLHKYGVILIDEESLVPDKLFLKEVCDNHFTCNYRFGWYYQQFLKMQFAVSQYAKEYYLIWDSDTVPLNQLSFFKCDKMIFSAEKEYHKPYFKTIKALLGYEKEVTYSFIAEHMLVSVSIMKELIQTIESSKIEGDRWPVKVINTTPVDEPNAFSEFETYGTFCHHNYPDRFIFQTLRPFRNGGEHYSRLVSTKRLKKLSVNHDTISLENWSTPKKKCVKTNNRREIQFLNFLYYWRTHFLFHHFKR